MSGMFGGGDQTSTSVQELPAWAQPIAQDIWNNGSQAIGNQDPTAAQSPYPTVAPMNQAQLTGMGMTLGRGLSGSPLEDSGQGYANYMLGKGPQADPYSTQANPYMGYGPAFQDMLTTSNNALADSFARGTGAQTTANFARAGAQGGSAQQEAETANANQLAGILGNNTNSLLQSQFNNSGNMFAQQQALASNSYGNSMGNLNNILGQVGALSGLDYRNAAAVSGVGNQQFGYSQSQFDALNNQYNSAYQQPFRQTDQYLALLRGVLGNSGSSTVTGSSGGSSMGQMAGAGLGLASLFTGS